MMRIVPVKNQEVESTNNLASTEEDVKPKLFSVERNQRWPVQGWTSGNDYVVDAESAEELAEEVRRKFTLDRKSRWPLQGWCKAPTAPKLNTGRSLDNGIPAAKARAESRWPQGW
jgi:hypothetical protein